MTALSSPFSPSEQLRYPVLVLNMFEHELRALQRKGLLRQNLTRTSAQGPEIRIGGRTYHNFASNDYLGLASHPALIRAANDCAAARGVGAGASRLLAGGGAAHERLERHIARFKGTDAALLFNSGYSANTGTIPAIAPAGTIILSDELNHASIIDGCRLSRAETIIFPHRDTEHLGRLLRQHRSRRKIVITDTVFSMDGDIAPLPEISSLCRRYGAMLYLDDAHGTGVLGEGRGALAHFGLSPAPDIIQVGTFSKALGSCGAFVAADADSIRWIANTARSFLFSTALPECVAAASDAALRIVSRRPALVRRLWKNREHLAVGIAETGLSTGSSQSPVIPLLMKSVEEALSAAAFFMQHGIYAPAIRPPTVSQARLRITVTAAHATVALNAFLETLRRWKKQRKG